MSDQHFTERIYFPAHELDDVTKFFSGFFFSHGLPFDTSMCANTAAREESSAATSRDQLPHRLISQVRQKQNGPAKCALIRSCPNQPFLSANSITPSLEPLFLIPKYPDRLIVDSGGGFTHTTRHVLCLENALILFLCALIEHVHLELIVDTWLARLKASLSFVVSVPEVMTVA